MRSWRIVGSSIVPLRLGQLDEQSLGAAAERRRRRRRARRARPTKSPARLVEVAGDRAGRRPRAPRAAAAGAEAGALEHERGVGDGPAVVEAADDRVVGDAGVGEEHLVEHRAAGHLPQRADLDAGLVHVEARSR